MGVSLLATMSVSPVSAKKALAGVATTVGERDEGRGYGYEICRGRSMGECVAFIGTTFYRAGDAGMARAGDLMRSTSRWPLRTRVSRERPRFPPLAQCDVTM